MKLLIFGGSGFVGSAICRTAVRRGWEVTSCSRSGEPFKSKTGHTPAWVNKVVWRKGTPFDPSSFAPLLSASNAVISTLGVLLESPYKFEGTVSPFKLLESVVKGWVGDRGNPLSATGGDSYERMNRDAALAIFHEFAKSSPAKGSPASPFVFISAEDIFRPIISSRYVSTKREVECTILSELAAIPPPQRSIRPIFVRPSLIYHPHVNPFTTLPATVLSASSHIQAFLPSPLRLAHSFPPSNSPFAPLSPPTSSLASLLSLPPIHVDTIAEAVCRSIENPEVEGVLDVQRMRAMLGFDDAFDLEGICDDQPRNSQKSPPVN